MKAELRWLDMILAEGSLDILAYLKDKAVVQFKELLTLKNKRTNRGFSPNTISARVDELEKMGALQTSAVRTARRRVLGYEITEKGKEILKTAYEFEERLNGIIQIR